MIRKYTVVARHVKARRGHATYGDASAQFNAIARGPDQELAVIGHFTGTLDLGTGPHPAVGEQDLLIHRAPL